MYQLQCWYCHKPVTNQLPENVVFRAIAVCPECIKDLPEAENHPAPPPNTQLKIDTPPVEHDEDCDSYNIGGKCNCRSAWWRAT